MNIAPAQMQAAQAAYDNLAKPEQNERFDPDLECSLRSISRDLDSAVTACERGNSAEARRLARQVMNDLAYELADDKDRAVLHYTRMAQEAQK